MSQKLMEDVDTSQSVNVRLTPVSTLLKYSAREQHLHNHMHPDQDFVAYILKDIWQDFRDSTHNFISATKSMHSATLNPQVIEEYIKLELILLVLFQRYWHQLFTLIGLV